MSRDSDNALDCMWEAVDAAQDAIARGRPTAVAVLGEPYLRRTDEAFWTGDRLHGFQQAVADAARANGQTFGAIVVPVIAGKVDRTAEWGWRPLDRRHLPRQGEYEALLILSFDLGVGFDLHRCLYARRPDGTPVFDDVETLISDVGLADETPGLLLLRQLVKEV